MHTPLRWESSHGTIELVRAPHAVQAEKAAKALARAQELAAQGEHAAARALCNEALLAEVDNVEALILLGHLAYEQGQMDDALKCLRRAAGAGPVPAETYYLIGEVSRVRGDTVAAIAAFRDAVAADPEHPASSLRLTEELNRLEGLSSKFEVPRYTYSDYSSANALRWSPAVIGVTLYLSRHFLYPIVALVSMMLSANTSYDMTKPLVALSDSLLLIASIPAIVVVGLDAFRRPNSGPLLRGFWRGGRWLLVLSAILDAALVLWLSQVFIREPLTSVTIFYVVADFAVCTYLFASQRARDFFASFPFNAGPV